MMRMATRVRHELAAWIGSVATITVAVIGRLHLKPPVQLIETERNVFVLRMIARPGRSILPDCRVLLSEMRPQRTNLTLCFGVFPLKPLCKLFLPLTLSLKTKNLHMISFLGVFLRSPRQTGHWGYVQRSQQKTSPCGTRRSSRGIGQNDPTLIWAKRLFHPLRRPIQKLNTMVAFHRSWLSNMRRVSRRFGMVWIVWA